MAVRGLDEPQIEVVGQRVDGVALLRVSGEVDVLGAPLVIEHVRQHVADGATRIVVDLADVRLLDGRGLSALVAAHFEAVRGGAHLDVVGARGVVRRAIDLALLTYLLADVDLDAEPAGADGVGWREVRGPQAP